MTKKRLILRTLGYIFLSLFLYPKHGKALGPLSHVSFDVYMQLYWNKDLQV